MALNFSLKTFDGLTNWELYSLLQLRSEVFVVEQNCVYQDMDGKDEIALHLMGFKNQKLVTYARIFAPGDYFEEASIGRVIVRSSERKFGYGHELMRVAANEIKARFDTSKIRLSAQQYLIKFYNAHGYRETGEGYLEDDIPHIAMIRE